MGSCISKCRPKTSAHRGCNHVQDKLVISQPPTTTPVPLPKNQPYSPPSCSSPSFSSTTCITTSSYSSSASSACSSSILISKDRSFSNEFLRSCAREHPHIVRVNSIKVSPVKSVPNKFHARKFESPYKSVVAPSKQSVPQRLVGSIPQKRARASSPTLTRQKSFRKEPERPNSTFSLPSRTLASPSPSRRFNGETCRGHSANTPRENYKRQDGFKANSVNPVSLSGRKENLRPPSPSNNPSRYGPCMKKRETFTHQVDPEVDQIAVGEVLSNYDINSLPIDDIDNPLISLDCFIFL